MWGDGEIGRWGDGVNLLKLTAFPLFPIPDSRFPIPDSLFPTTAAKSTIFC
ncbi:MULTISPECIES: hypothetical protein [Moorena]|uniref:Uncharacterized protein n=1 Tax=Moorena producens (strain JHB) TaxID=1454205 RepID=A0A9Q9SUR0_MOOP1|nr:MULTISPECIES: hypothetical protein [Moorena]WAN70012.1 hypothetical protein BJP36_38750 [Moorena producens JHB]